MFIISVILQSFLLVSMAFAGGSKLAGAKNFVEMFESIELPQWFRVVTGLVQLAGAAGLVIGYWWHAFHISESSILLEKRYQPLLLL